MTEFVKCIKDGGEAKYLTIGKLYKVVDRLYTNEVRVISDTGQIVSFYENQFDPSSDFSGYQVVRKNFIHDVYSLSVEELREELIKCIDRLEEVDELHSKLGGIISAFRVGI